MKDKTTSRNLAAPKSLENSFSMHSNEGMNSSDVTLQTQSQVTSLYQLRIKDFALVSEDVIQFSPGLNVITGESGSGKSVLVCFLAPSTHCNKSCAS
jgi:predicted ATPase